MSTMPQLSGPDAMQNGQQPGAQPLGQAADEATQTTQEHTPSHPMQGTADDPKNSQGLTVEDQQKLIALVRRYKEQWAQDRIAIVERCLENLEFFKGNQFVSFDPNNFQFFDVMNWWADSHPEDSDDTDLYQYCNNFYQMLCTGFIAALSPQLPKATILPEDAENLADVTTAKAGQTLIDIIQRQNKAKAKLRQQLMYLYCCGAAFRHTRYLVDADRAGTHKEPVFDITDTQILPDRYHCFNCGTDSPADSMAAMVSRACPKCASFLGPESYYPGENGPAVMQVGEDDVPNGMVAWDIYSPLEVDADPRAKKLEQTPILSLSVETHLGALRSSYPDMYDQISGSTTTVTGQSDSLDRIARLSVTSQNTAYSGQMQEMRPTLDRTWIQPWAFGLDDDKDFVQRMTTKFKQGVLLVNTGDIFLEARPSKMTKEWTWAATHETFGLFPPAVGDVVVPFQKRYNNLCNVVDEYMDRCAAGLTLGNTDVIDSKSLSGKPLLPGVINPIKLKRSAPGTSMAEALYQFKFTIEQAAFEYLEKLVYNAQMFAGIPAQVYGGAGDPNIQTKGGQEQQLQVALGKLNIYWENIREENAEAFGLAIRCASDNLTDDMRQVVQEKGSEFRNNYVRLDQLQGQVNSYPDTDQGFPLSAAELRDRWSDLMQEAGKQNPVALAIFDDPTNQEQAANALGVPGMVVPGSAMRAKVLQILEELKQGAPQQMPGPDGQPAGPSQPSILPDRDIDDFEITRQVVRQYCQENADLRRKNANGWANILAYLTAAVAMQTQWQAEQEQNKAQIAQAGMPPQPQAPPKSEIPPDEMNQVVGRLNDLMNMPPAATKGVIAGQVSAAGQLVKIGQAMQK